MALVLQRRVERMRLEKQFCVLYLNAGCCMKAEFAAEFAPAPVPAVLQTCKSLTSEQQKEL